MPFCSTAGGKYLYAIKVFTSGESFNLCPADICYDNRWRRTCAHDLPARRRALVCEVEGYTPPREVIEAIEYIARAVKIDVGGIEYIVDDRDGSLLYYDINALSKLCRRCTTPGFRSPRPTR